MHVTAAFYFPRESLRARWQEASSRESESRALYLSSQQPAFFRDRASFLRCRAVARLPAVARSERALSMPACPPAKVMELTCRLSTCRVQRSSMKLDSLPMEVLDTLLGMATMRGLAIFALTCHRAQEMTASALSHRRSIWEAGPVHRIEFSRLISATLGRLAPAKFVARAVLILNVLKSVQSQAKGVLLLKRTHGPAASISYTVDVPAIFGFSGAAGRCVASATSEWTPERVVQLFAPFMPEPRASQQSAEQAAQALSHFDLPALLLRRSGGAAASSAAPFASASATGASSVLLHDFYMAFLRRTITGLHPATAGAFLAAHARYLACRPTRSLPRKPRCDWWLTCLECASARAAVATTFSGLSFSRSDALTRLVPPLVLPSSRPPASRPLAPGRAEDSAAAAEDAAASQGQAAGSQVDPASSQPSTLIMGDLGRAVASLGLSMQHVVEVWRVRSLRSSPRRRMNLLPHTSMHTSIHSCR